MKKKIIAICILAVMIINALVIAVQAATPNPYGTTAYGCITNISMKSYMTLKDDVTYFTSTVSSLKAGTGSEARPFETYGAIGGENTKLFVYSMGKNNNTDFATKTVKTLMEQFAAENPDWIPLAAINGDFFDIETSNTAGIGEPENIMIQNGDIYKGHLVSSAGGGAFGIKPDGSIIYHINGFTTTYTYTKGRYNLTVMNGNQTQTLGNHNRIPVDNPNYVTFITPDSAAADLTGKTVYVIDCDTYRYAYRGGSGKVDPEGDYTYFFEGKVESVRSGAANEKPASGKVYISVPSGTETKLAANTYVKCNAVIGSNWADVENAMGFKQAILVNGDSSFVKGLTSSSAATTKVSDISYSVYNANRSAIGFKADGTPVILAIARTNGKGATYYEMAEQLKALGCTYGFCLDGGGSTTMVIRNNSGAYETVFSGESGNTGRSVGNVVILAVPKNPQSNPGGNTGTTQDTNQNTEEKPTTGTTEKPTDNTPTEPDLNNTFVEIEKGNGYVAHSTSAPTVTDTKLGISGYAGFTQNIVNSGYYFDDDKNGVKWNSNFLSAADDATQAIAGDKAMSFNMEINIPELETGEHTISFMLKLADGTFVIIDTASFTVEAKQTPTAPAPTTSSSGCGGTVGGISVILVSIAAIPLFLRKKKK